jgi:tetratricopeptide (TPR) repeat protein
MSRDRAQAARDAAKRFESQGKFDAALKKHIWFHNHALKIRKSYYGVRLSFALGYWMELAQKYPPALVALRKIRDRKAARLSSGKEDRALFHDVESINDRLNESAATVALFKKIDKINERFASAIYDLADEAIIKAGEYVLARKHLRDPTMRFEIAQRNFEEGMQYAETSQCIEASKRAYRTIFVGDVLRLITVLEKTGELTLAKRFQSKALRFLNHKAIRNAIKGTKQAPSMPKAD